MTEILPPMIKCNECIFAKPYYDIFIGTIGYRCKEMTMIGEFGDEYSLQNTGCTEGIKMTQEQAKEYLNNYICCCPYGTSPTKCGDEKCEFGQAIRALLGM